ncbi:hypothetical protein FGIG_05897 [Fasciola gigantica]|uniref:Uncharacterized protein n=1 Tax=Fasciola gigantica TaxID=46835 RepID=A0A504YN10_FASGI|nr:hypothetical protein FGIG_05897 [Fasciola gigantica]
MSNASHPHVFSGLTMNINQAFLPDVPCLLPSQDRREVSSFVGQESEAASSLTSDVGLKGPPPERSLPVEAPEPPVEGTSGILMVASLCTKYYCAK